MDGRRYTDRGEAGRVLADILGDYAEREDVVIHALPRGGVPVAHEIARRLDLPLDVMVVRKLGTPGHEELAMGAVASGGVTDLNDGIIHDLQIPEATVAEVAERERDEVRDRERRFRGDRETPAVAGRTVIVVDDGVATGSTLRAALRALRRRDPERVVVAVPVAPPSVIDDLDGLAEEVHCPLTPQRFGGVGAWYRDFDQVSDDEVRRLLDAAAPTGR
jgi:putative phosphoribosyl transferase